MRRFWYRFGLLVCLGASGLAPAVAQEAAMTERAPRFLVSAAQGTVPVDVGRTPVLRRRIALDLRDVTLGEALETIARESGLRLGYSRAVVPVNRVVRLVAEDITVAGALSEVLFDSGVDVLFDGSGMAAAIVRRPAAPKPGSMVGRVTDAKTGQGLPGAEVLLERSRWRAMTGGDGRYRLAEVEPGSYTLTVRRIGYAKRSVPVTLAEGEEATVDVTLEAVPTQLDEVVTTATGEQRIRELGHVVGRINADSLVKEAPVANITELLTARVPGLLIQQQQGTVGGEVKLQIRSSGSIRLSTEPIVIVDGVRYTTNPRSGPTSYILGPFGSEGTSRLNDLNPNDVESIEVVKGPSAATLYGTDAANGVIVITTKRGRPGPARWSGYARASTSEIPQHHYPDSYWGWGTTTLSCTLVGVAGGTCVQDSVTVRPNPLNDPALSIFSSKPRWEYGANVAGGRQDLRYYFSADFEDATGPLSLPATLAEEIKSRRGVRDLPEELLEPNAFTKFNLRSTVTADLGKRAELRTTVGYTQNSTRSLISSNPFRGAGLGWTAADPYPPGWDPAEAFAQSSTERINRFFGSATGEWRPAEWLLARGTVGLDLTSSNRYSLARPGEAQNTSYAGGQVGDDRTRYIASSADLGVTAAFRLGRLSSRTAVGAQYVRTVFDALTSTGSGLAPGGSSIGQAASVRTSQSYYERVTLGSYLEETLGLNDRLFLTGALRMDGASSFGRDYDAAFYPKAGLSWILSEEPFLPRLPGVDELRLRYAYGASGQQPWPQWTLPSYGLPKYQVDGQAGNALHISYLGNPDLRPERVREHELGLDLSALQQRARLSLTWNRRTAIDQLNPTNLPPGYGLLWTNLGRIDGSGFEAQLTLRPVESRLVSWDIALNHAWNTSTLTDLGGGAENRRAEGGYAEGFPIGGRFSRPLLGYNDANGNGIIEQQEVQLGDSLLYVGRSIPPRTQTLSTVLGLFQQRVRLSALLDRQSGFLVADMGFQSRCNFSRVCRAAVDPTTPFEAQVEVAATQAAGTASYYAPMEPGDFTRLREVTLALDLPTGWVRTLRLRSASLSISARNLALWTAYRGADPETMLIPQARAWAFRFDLGL